MNNDINLKKASMIIYLSLIFGIPHIVLAEKYMYYLSTEETWSMMAGAVIFLSFFAYVAKEISKNKTWAIWVYSILSLASLFQIGQLSREFYYNALLGSIGVLQWGLQYYAVYLIFEKKIKSFFGIQESNISDFSNERGTRNFPSTENDFINQEIHRKIPSTSNTSTEKTENNSESGKTNFDDKIKHLKELSDLKEHGALTEEEFQAEKKKILSR